MTKFEVLPNEILIECFEYFNAVHIFHAFNQLNNRFNQLIRTIPLYLNFENIERSIFNQICMEISQNQEIKKQIYSLHLSNKSTCWQIQPFLSYFSLDEFIHLRSVTLTEVTKNDLSQVKSMLPLLPRLSCFHLIDNIDETGEILYELPMTKLRTLTLTSLLRKSTFISELSSITNLTIANCSLTELFQLLHNTSRLKYLNVQYMYTHHYPIINHVEPSTHLDIYLTKLVIMKFYGKFNEVAMILKQTPNLKSLTISMDYSIGMIDADEWEHLIASSLPYLSIFKFFFECNHHYHKFTIKKKFEEFRNDFWQKQHRWYTEYSISEDFASIYIIPYMSNTYELHFNTERYRNELTNNVHKFDNVIDLIIDRDEITEKCQYYFSNVTSLTLNNMSIFIEDPLLETKYIKYLKMIVNLSNVRHLRISSFDRLEMPSILSEVLKEAQQLTGLTINPDCLVTLFHDNELRKYLTKMIIKLNLHHFEKNPFDNFDVMKQFSEIFSNIEELTCRIDDQDSLLFLIKNLPKLSRINISSKRTTIHHRISQLSDIGRFLNLLISSSDTYVDSKPPDEALKLSRNPDRGNTLVYSP